MHIVKLNGGLGNQMFQYAFALALEKRYGGVSLDLTWINADGAHNGYELDRHFRVRLPVCSAEERRAIGDVDPSVFGRARRKLRLTKKSQFSARSLTWEPYFLSVSRDSYFLGYWQSYKYYTGMEDAVRGAFEFVEPLSEKNTTFLANATGRTLIGIHVRRGDSLANPTLARDCDAEYYRAASALATANTRDPLFAFFSDDLDWCKDKLAVAGEALFVDWNRKRESYADMRLMAACDTMIIANSSFSWWGAWLGERAGHTVIAPSRWFAGCRTRDNRHIMPANWKRIVPT